MDCNIRKLTTGKYLLKLKNKQIHYLPCWLKLNGVITKKGAEMDSIKWIDVDDGNDARGNIVDSTFTKNQV